MESVSRRLKVLFITAWYPSESDPFYGIFVKEHAKAVSLFNDIVVMYPFQSMSPDPDKLYKITEDIEDGIRTVRVEYSNGILSFLRSRLFRVKYTNSVALPATPTKGFHPFKRVTPLKRFIEIKDRLVRRFIEIKDRYSTDLSYYWSVLAAFRKLKKSGWKPDIIHAHVFTAGVPAIILGKLYRIPVVITEHAANFATHELTHDQLKKAKAAMGKADLVLPVTEAMKHNILAYGIKNNFLVVPNAVNTEIFHPSPSLAQEHRNKKLLLVAALRPEKGIPYLLQALYQLKAIRSDFSLDIVGSGPEQAKYEQMAKDLSLENMVNFNGSQSKQEVARFMQNCDFFVLPSTVEQLPCVLIEAMACGKPVLATNVGGVSEIVNEERGIMIPPKDVDALKEAIIFMLDNYATYSSENIEQYARENFSYEALGKKLDSIYRDVLSARAK
jgi:glycosyltransferase involved in cell wall biosynthesis